MVDHSFDIYAQRRADLCARMRAQSEKNGVLMFVSNYEQASVPFRQNSTFYYFTGIREPGCVLLMHLDGPTILYIPCYPATRTQWVTSGLDCSDVSARMLQIDAVKYLGDACCSYSFFPTGVMEEFTHLVADLDCFHAQGARLLWGHDLTALPAALHQFLFYRYLATWRPAIMNDAQPITSLVAAMRVKKSAGEIAAISHAVSITIKAQEAAAARIKVGCSEQDLHAEIAYTFAKEGARHMAFPSIVGSGLHSTVLHYTGDKGILRADDVVVIDIGAEYEGYAADITRTYCVGKRFTPRAREVYELVGITQRYIAEKAAPGMFLRNAQEPERSLHHMAVSFLHDYGYAQYFPHGIGHFLGLEVHDVGDVMQMLEPGNVITIEPGIYIPQEHIGVRIEDDYLITEDGCVCLSEALPKAVMDVEEMVQ